VTEKPATAAKPKADPVVYMAHSEDWSTVILFSKRVDGMRYALDEGLKFTEAAYGTDIRATAAKPPTSGGQLTSPTPTTPGATTV